MGSKEFTKLLSSEGEDRLRVKIVLEKGVIKDIVIQYETKIRDKWYQVVRYDCSHGYFHRDVLNHKGDKTKQAIPILNLSNALTYAEQDLKDKWQWYKERFMKGMRI